MDQAAEVMVGVDLVEGNLAPLRFASWWSRTHGVQFRAVHVISASSIDLLDSLADYAEGKARESLGFAVGSVDPRPIRNSVIRALTAGYGLVEACGEFGANLIVLGRRGFNTGPSWFRLGPVARHLLHGAPAPVVIVPRRWEPPSEPGPVVAMVGPDDASSVALHAARKHADALEVELIVAHAAKDPAPELAWYFAPSAIEDLRAKRLEMDKAAFEPWLAAQELPGESTYVHELSCARSLATDLVERVAPSLVVVGSRRLAVRDRWFGSSTSTDLAAHLDAPVLVAASDAASFAGSPEG